MSEISYQRIKSHPFFKDFPQEVLQEVSALAGVGHFHPGQRIFRTGEAAKYFYLIKSGEVSLEIDLEGHGPIVVNNLHSGDVVGWSWLTPPFHWQFDARTVSDADLIVLDGERLLASFETNFRLSHYFHQAMLPVIAKRLQAARTRLMEFYNIFPAPSKDRPGWQKLLPDDE